MSSVSIPDILLQGLYQRRCVSLLYDGSTRMVEPYAIGISQANNPVVRVWQTSGGSGSGWRLLEICKISNAFVTDATFQPARPGYNPGDRGMSRIYHAI